MGSKYGAKLLIDTHETPWHGNASRVTDPLYHIVWYRIVSYSIIYHIISYIVSYGIVSYHIASHGIVSYYIMRICPYFIELRRVLVLSNSKCWCFWRRAMRRYCIIVDFVFLSHWLIGLLCIFPASIEKQGLPAEENHLSVETKRHSNDIFKCQLRFCATVFFCFALKALSRPWRLMVWITQWHYMIYIVIIW